VLNTSMSFLPIVEIIFQTRIIINGNGECKKKIVTGKESLFYNGCRSRIIEHGGVLIYGVSACL